MQLSLPTLNISAARPLIPVEACMVLLDRNEDEVLHAIESGILGWAWDISAVGEHRREIRVWRDSLLALLNGNRGPELEEAKVFARVLPPRSIRSPELQRIFSCSQTHVQTLIERGYLKAEAPRQAESGPRAYTLVTRESVAMFLRSARVL